MTSRSTPRISSRKQPRQARSTALVTAILQAAIQVLAEEGAPRFTTARVAERAGVSIGSVYQYFPNKAAILFQLQFEEWQRTTTLLRDILQDTRHPPFQRMRSLVLAFVRSECEEAAMRTALDDAAPLYRDAPEVTAAKAAGEGIFQTFVQEVLPNETPVKQALVCELVTTTLGAVGKAFSVAPRSETDITAFAAELGEMLCGYLQLKEGKPRGGD
ncbi:TPA: TetR/AcrR family transcriptional regulator [Kluyvera intermedia]|uniref:TetR/AcrR family transcriptional regulator n=2 Tax=Enterobacteriaceae TaxID=543 RepID=A0A9P3TD49_KLUIN|nr:TetR family transcriptional regulator [Phytobacter ursingii]HAT2207312.1 TetR/AcrR family transcriptional regulator [Kluyvera intermedia]AKL13829.1 TetR family transcriptional regulator [Phytobacter ursingii]HAT2208273.1 TetR/AcrR family transcriptional regulator [Kluyvera intermedia]HAT2518006.1 TetR/AcrR family transcriptional regulator [Kluyvera intermedia]HAT2518970.1 TetR/AcrR family transcriptional regulator [Kluyvera intermedia]